MVPAPLSSASNLYFGKRLLLSQQSFFARLGSEAKPYCLSESSAVFLFRIFRKEWKLEAVCPGTTEITGYRQFLADIQIGLDTVLLTRVVFDMICIPGDLLSTAGAKIKAL